jgi:hypothetical protein
MHWQDFLNQPMRLQWTSQTTGHNQGRVFTLATQGAHWTSPPRRSKLACMAYREVRTC